MKELCTTWNVSCRKVLGLDPRTRTHLIAPLMKTLPIEDIIMHRTMSFFLNGLYHESNNISHFFTNVLVSNSSYMLTNVNTILQKAEIKYSDLFHINKLSLKKALQKSAPQPDWRSNIVRELMDIRDGQLISNLEKEETNAMLRHISTYRWNDLPVSPPSNLLYFRLRQEHLTKCEVTLQLFHWWSSQWVLCLIIYHIYILHLYFIE